MLVKVLEVRRNGLLVEILSGISKGESAWLSQNEWSSDQSEWQHTYDTISIGDEIDVTSLMTKVGPDGQKCVSKKNFSVKDIDDTWRRESKIMIVEDATKDKIIGHVDGVSAIMDHLEYKSIFNSKRLSNPMLNHIQLGKGDRLRGIVSDDIFDDDRLVLGCADHLLYLQKELTNLVQDANEKARFTAGTSPKLAREIDDEESIYKLDEKDIENISPLLLAENEESLRKTISEFMADIGVDVYSVGSFEEAQNAIIKLEQSHSKQTGRPHSNTFRFAILDPNLKADERDMSGLNIIKCLPRNSCRFLVISGEDPKSEKVNINGGILIHYYLEKPFMLEELLHCISASLTREPKCLRHWIDSLSSDLTYNVRNVSSIFSDDLRTVQQQLNDLGTRYPDVELHVFRLHERSLRARSIARYGQKLKWVPLSGKVGKSPIKDAAFTEDEYIYTGLSTKHKNHEWTLEMMDYRSFFGVPIRIPGYYKYCLVAFHPEENELIGNFQFDCRLCAEQIARIIERDIMTAFNEADSKYLARGVAFENLSHELYSLMSAEGTQIDMLKRHFKTYENTLLEADGNITWHYIMSLRETISHTKDLANILHAERVNKEDWQPISVLDCLRHAILGLNEVLKDYTDHPERIFIRFPERSDRGEDQPAGELWRTNAAVASLTTVFFNIYLNAIQQILAINSIRSYGRIDYSLEYRLEPGEKPWGIVKITDSGPGIHFGDWKRIFDRGFTTKDKGTGLGLYISNYLLDQIRDGRRRASLVVGNSILWEGTTFVVKIPLVFYEKEQRYDE